ncbi:MULTISPECIES: S-layer homology domain-containing protein [Paenibacillus]|uniref:S-layer homology domain-containing protein n=1 Tax=Paenibacillus violae TaxID=3077234 RepID=A0ABU3R5W2_9BACL|nr:MULTISPECIES: S-layer homology domain-containing protein [Paenibacillus]MDU0199643.1 S-layer homology domain-containing protein [Paenibacillus sp. PFR10]MEC0267805.1 S-layer homology domain-containing protein [Paenibacillus anseongense]
MKHKIILGTLVCNLSCFAALLSPAYAENASQFGLKTSAAESTGEFTVTLQGTNLQDLYAYEAKISFDASKLEVINANTKIEGFSISPIVKNNEVTFAHTKVGSVSGEKGNLDMGTITFKAKKAGTSQLTWTSVKIVDHNLQNQSLALDKSFDFTKIFSDLVDHWAKTDVMSMVDKNIVEGMDDDHFAPDATVTRAQFATLIARALDLKSNSVQPPFTDVAVGSWYEDTVKKVYAAGLINGISDREFAPEKNISREEMAAMLMRAKSHVTGMRVEDMTSSSSLPFNDEDLISDWAKKVVQLAVDAGLMNGRTAEGFAPQGQATRAEAVVVLKRLLAGLK